MASLKTSGLQRFVEKVLVKFVLREEITNLIQITAGIGYNTTSSSIQNLTGIHDISDEVLKNAKYFEVFDESGALAISATIDSDGTINNVCTRCGKVTAISCEGHCIAGVITKYLGSCTYFKIYGIKA